MAQGKEYTEEEKHRIIYEVLKPYFLLGQSLLRACINGRIPYTTLKTWYDKDEVLRKEIESWQTYANSKAEENIVKALNEGDREISKWWLERRLKKEYSTKIEQEIEQRVVVDTLREKLKDIIENEDDQDQETE